MSKNLELKKIEVFCDYVLKFYPEFGLYKVPYDPIKYKEYLRIIRRIQRMERKIWLIINI